MNPVQATQKPTFATSQHVYDTAHCRPSLRMHPETYLGAASSVRFLRVPILFFGRGESPQSAQLFHNPLDF